MSDKPVKTFAAFHLQGLIISLPILFISFLDAVIPEPYGWIVNLCGAILASYYLTFSIFSKPDLFIPIVYAWSTPLIIILMVGAIGMGGLSIFFGMFLDTRSPIMITLFLFPIVLISVSFFMAMADASYTDRET